MEDANATLPRTDHDTLIRLETKFDTFSSQVIGDIKELKDGTQARLTIVEARLALIEKVHDEVQPIDGKKKLNELLIWRSNFQSNLKFIIALAGAIGGLVGVISSIMLILSHVIKL